MIYLESTLPLRLDLLLLLRLNLHRIWLLPAPPPLLPPSIEAIGADRDKLMCSGFLARKKKHKHKETQKTCSGSLSAAQCRSCVPDPHGVPPPVLFPTSCSLTAPLNAAAHLHPVRVKAVCSVPERFQFFCSSAIDFFFILRISAIQSHRSAAEYAKINQPWEQGTA